MKYIKKYIYLFIIMLISIYYTNKSIDILKSMDPIMKQIKNTSEKYSVDPINAVIDDKYISSGAYGKAIDYKESYSKMKTYGKYNEALTVLKETKPTISIEDNYNKYLIRGNPNKRNIALIFKMKSDKNIIELLSLLESESVQVTFFIDGTFLENNINMIRKLSNHEVEILSYNESQNEELMKTSINYLESITNRKSKYCYTEIDNDKLLNSCAKNKLHTIKPNIVIDKDLSKNIKKDLSSGITITINNYNNEELIYSIRYLKSKGYNLVTVSDLYSEG